MTYELTSIQKGVSWRLPPRSLWPRGASLPLNNAMPFLLPLAILALWQLVAARGWMSPQILPSPLVVAQTLFDLIGSGDIARALAVSLQRIAIGFASGALLGFVIGFAIAVSPSARTYIEPSLRALFAIPTLGWLPILMLVFGIDETLKYLIIAKAVLVPVTLNTAAGVRNVPLAYIEAADVLRLSPWTRFWKLRIPAALPTLFAGIRLGLSSAFIALVVVEMLAATEGVGYMMVWGRTLFQTDIVIAGMIVVGLIGFALDKALKATEARLRAFAHD